MKNSTNIKIGFLFIVINSLLLLGSAQNGVSKLLYSGPILCQKPIISDTVDVKGDHFDENSLLKQFPISNKYFENAQTISSDTNGIFLISSNNQKHAVHFLKTFVSVSKFQKVTMEVKGSGMFVVYINGEKKKDKLSVDSLPKAITFEQSFEPMTYELVIKYLSLPDSNKKDNQLKISIKSEKTIDCINFTLEPQSTFTIYNLQDGKNIRSVATSPNGKYCVVTYSERKDDETIRYAELMDNETGKVLLQNNGYLLEAEWMPKSNLLYFSRKGLQGTELITMDPTNFQMKTIETNLPDGNFSMAPNETTLIYSIKTEAEKEKNSMIRILDNSDRYGQFRTRYHLAKYDLKTGVYQPLTFGYRTTYLSDISHDSQYILFGTSQTDYTKRPFTASNLYRLHLETFKIDTLYENEPYVGGAQFSPDDAQLIISGGPESFHNVGLNIGKEKTANSYDEQLYIFDITTKKVTPITKNFNPSVESYVWNSSDQKIYMKVVDQDCNNIYVYNPVDQKFTKINLPEDVVKSISIASSASAFNFYGQSVSNADRLYFYGGKKPAVKCLYDLSKEKLKNVVLGEVHDWNFISKDGTTITGRYYLPPHFDSTKTYPMLVYYYGGTTPTVRSLEFSYSMHMYAALGYVVYTLNPSGTIGFGQEFSARHVNAWGIRTADEIIDGTKQFFKTHSYIDSSKIGCFGASYGGFMTMYLQTQTDVFAAAISHAGISALSSYWGEGNWGIGYCSVANADTYPWNNQEFFIKQSPLFQADKINTPILLLHGTKDDNVPIGESIQMYNALRILGKEVELIEVEGENHGVADYYKRISWAKTMQAWFAKYLQNDPTWWNEIYPDVKGNL